MRIVLPAGFRLRTSTDADFATLVDLRNAGMHPVRQWTIEHRRQWEKSTRGHDALLEVVEDEHGTIVGFGELDAGGSFRQPDGSLFTNVRVTATHRCRGIGSALAKRIEREARTRGAPRILASVPETEPDAVRWASRRGWRERWRQLESYLHLESLMRDISAVPAPKPDIEIVPLVDLLGRDGESTVEALHDIYRRAYADIPGNPAAPLSQTGFRALLVDGPLAAPDLSYIAVAGGRPVALTVNLRRGPGRGYTAFTGTLAPWRRRGIARAIKAAALLRAQQLGIRVMLTANDGANEPMLRLNRWLGYAPLPAIVHLERELG